MAIFLLNCGTSDTENNQLLFVDKFSPFYMWFTLHIDNV